MTQCVSGTLTLRKHIRSVGVSPTTRRLFCRADWYKKPRVGEVSFA
ncbi:MAG: hypothetical protein NZ843_06500 [Fimbriimonadales bacterium]|nr:hypothetical protein [Fimbriimonadales bacterium]